MSNIRIMRNFILTLVMAGIAAPTFAQGLPQTTPEEVGLSQERLDRIDKAIREDVENNELRGALAMVARKGKLAYITYHGMADTEKNIPMAEDTIFRIYSMSKPITSVAVMMLFEEGHFFLDDPVSKFIPELGGLRVIDEDAESSGGVVFNIPDEIEEVNKARAVKVIPANTAPSNRDMTIRDLLRHTSGLTYGFFGNTKVDQMYQQNGVLITDMNLEDMVRKLSNFPLLFQPGDQWHYSLSVDVLGRLVEVVSGQPFDEFLQERIFAPLDMVDTGFYVPKEKMNRFANLYAPAKDGDGVVPANPMMSRNFIAKPREMPGKVHTDKPTSAEGHHTLACILARHSTVLTLLGHRVLDAPVNPCKNSILTQNGQGLTKRRTHTRPGDGHPQWLGDLPHADLFGLSKRADLGFNGFWGKVIEVRELAAEGLQKFEPFVLAFDERFMHGLAVVDNRIISNEREADHRSTIGERLATGLDRWSK